MTANDWLPEAMNFPAIDPDRKESEADEVLDEDFDDEISDEANELDDEDSERLAA